jgi:ATP-dependent helicase/nuclease subunit A
VLHFINLIFRELMTKEFGGIDYLHDADLSAGAEYKQASNLPAAEIAFFEKPEKQTARAQEIYSVAEDCSEDLEDSREAEYIAGKIAGLAGAQYIWDTKIGAARKIRYQDIAILTRTAKRGGKIISALRRAGIPFYAAGFAGAAQDTDVDLLVDYLRLVQNRDQDIPLARVALSPMFGFDEEELFEIRCFSPKLSFSEALLSYKGNPNIENKVNSLFDMLKLSAQTAATGTVYEVLSGVIAATGFDEFLASQGSGRLSAAAGFLSAIQGMPERIGEFLERYKPYIPASGEADAVTILTIHKSKGLEFPVVFLAQAHEGFTHIHQSKQNVFLDRDLGIALKYYDTEAKIKEDSLAAAAFKLKAERDEKEELLRLMYVAMTRARNHLFVSGNKPKVNPEDDISDLDCPAEWIEYARRRNPAIGKYYIVPPDTFVLPERPVIAPEASKEQATPEFRYPYQAANSLRAKYTVTQLAAEDYSQDAVSWSGEYSQIQGNAYHKALQYIDFDAADIASALDGIAELTAEERAAVDAKVVERCLNTDIMQTARKSKILKEQPFMLYAPYSEIKGGVLRDKVLVQGIIDLLILGGQNIIVDYKMSGADAAAARLRYGKQLELYAKAAEAALGVKIHKKVILMLATGEEITIL